MNFTVDELLEFAAQHSDEAWGTLMRSQPFTYRVTESGIEYTPESGIARKVPRSELESFCNEFGTLESFSPGEYPTFWHKSYTLPLIQRFLRSVGRLARTADEVDSSDTRPA